MGRTVRVGTRGSRLALWQAHWVVNQLSAAHPDLTYEVVIVKTTGDHIQDVALSRIGDKGAFTKELEVALGEERIDLIVHSMKDVPTTLPQGMDIVAMLPRANAHDALVSAQATSIADLPAGARVGTGSLRRRAFLRALRPDIALVELRGNLDTRINQVEIGNLDAAVLACAGLERMNWMERDAHQISFTEMLPAVGQGAVGIEARTNDQATLDLVASINDARTQAAVEAERLIMRGLEGGCQVPLAAHVCDVITSDHQRVVELQAMVCTLDGARRIQVRLRGNPGDEEQLARTALKSLQDQGACELLAEVRRQFDQSSPDEEVVYA